MACMHLLYNAPCVYSAAFELKLWHCAIEERIAACCIVSSVGISCSSPTINTRLSDHRLLPCTFLHTSVDVNTRSLFSFHIDASDELSTILDFESIVAKGQQSCTEADVPCIDLLELFGFGSDWCYNSTESATQQPASGSIRHCFQWGEPMPRGCLSVFMRATCLFTRSRRHQSIGDQFLRQLYRKMRLLLRCIWRAEAITDFTVLLMQLSTRSSCTI